MEQVARFFEEGGLPMYPLLLVGVAFNSLLLRQRAWRGRLSPVPLRNRLITSVLGAFVCILGALLGYLANVFYVIGGVADGGPAMIYKGLTEALNVTYLGLALAIVPSALMLRTVFIEVRN